MRSRRLEDKHGNSERTHAMRNPFNKLSNESYISQLMRAIWAPAAVLLTLAVLVPAASAKTVTLHYFSKQTSNTILTPQGQPLAPNTQPSIGDVNDITGVDYAGNHKHHAKRATASDHLRCTITSFASGGGAATCDGQIAISGSMLLANAAPLTFSATNAPTVVSINGGTGVYRHAHGKIAVTSVGNNTDYVVRVTY